MKGTTDINKNKALGVLGLEIGVSRETILSRTEELSTQIESSSDPADHAELAKIYEATKTLLEEGKRPLYPREIRKKRMTIGGIASFILLLIIFVSGYSIISINRQNTYDNLQAMMEDASIVNYESMAGIVEKLPESYKDMASIKKEYATIKSNIDAIEDNNVFEESEKMQEAYYELVAIDEETQNWDLSYYLSRVDNRILLLDVRWENDDDYFHLEKLPDKEIKFTLNASLPNEKESEKDYEIYSRYNAEIFGYVEYPDRSNAFQAYEILSIEEDEIRIYAFSSDDTYTLYPGNS